MDTVALATFFFLQGRDHLLTTRVSRDGWLRQARLLEVGRFGAG
jgi:hypothetical protein